eukprot:tig00021464_g21751.t1
MASRGVASYAAAFAAGAGVYYVARKLLFQGGSSSVECESAGTGCCKAKASGDGAPAAGCCMAQSKQGAGAGAAAGGCCMSRQNAAPRLEDAELEAKILQLVGSHRIMIMMKGSREEPKCKFSRALMEILKEADVSEFGSYNILTGDQAIREGLKKYFDWPTYPMVIVGGKLIGGVDICKELHAAGELRSAFGL